MPDFGRHEKVPRPESVEALVRLLQNCPVVKQVSADGQLLTILRRGNKKDLQVFMTNVYIVSVADIHEILADQHGIDAIVTMSDWNAYSQEAEALCMEHGIGLFKFREFLGAVYYDADRFINYRPPKDNERRRYRQDSAS
jgi:hypothetical protein